MQTNLEYLLFITDALFSFALQFRQIGSISVKVHHFVMSFGNGLGDLPQYLT